MPCLGSSPRGSIYIDSFIYMVKTKRCTSCGGFISNDKNNKCKKCNKIKNSKHHKFKKTKKGNYIYPFSDKWENVDQKRNHTRRKLWSIEYKGGKCHVCGYSKCVGALEFHHIEPEYKKFAISSTSGNISERVLKKELDKCVLLCSNCHREVHADMIELDNLNKDA